MNNKTKWIIGGVLAFVLVLGCCLYFIPKTTPIDITLNATKIGDPNGERNDLGTVQIHVYGTIKEYLFRPSELTLEIDDFDIFYDIHAYANCDPYGNYPDVTVKLRESDYSMNLYGKTVENYGVFWANSTVTGEGSSVITVHFSTDLKNWMLLVSPYVYIDEAFEDDPSFDCLYSATVE